MKPVRVLLLQASGLLFAGLACAAPQHALTLYNEPPKYPADFKYFDYVNPDAPKGGIFRQAGFGGFDSLNPFISKGVAADDISMIYDTLAKQGLDEPFTEYGLVAGKIEKAPDNKQCVSICAPKHASTTVIRSAPRTWCSASRH